jgi:type II secretory pathway component GspD/PulD (secretin)
MAGRLGLTVGVALGLAASSALMAQVATHVTVAYENAPLSRVMGNFARYAGRSIAIADNVRDRTITVSLRDVEWSRALDFILEQNALIARPDRAGGIRIEKQQPFTVAYSNAPLNRVVRDISLFSRKAISIAPEAGNPTINYTARDLDWERALDELLAQNGLVAVVDVNGTLRVVPRH